MDDRAADGGDGRTWQLLFDTLDRFNRSVEALRDNTARSLESLHAKVDRFAEALQEHQEQDDRRFAQVHRRVDGIQAVVAGLIKSQRDMAAAAGAVRRDRRGDVRMLWQTLLAALTGGLGVAIATHFWSRP